MKKKTYLVDIPDPHNLDGEWVNLGEFETKQEAKDFCKEHGLDCLGSGVITTVDVDDGDEDE